MKSWQVWVGILVVFLSGVIIGALGSAAYIKAQLMKSAQEGPPAMRRLVVNLLTRELDLNAEQRKQIDFIVGENQKEMIQIRASMQPRMEAVFIRSIDQIHPYLNDEQWQKLDRLHKNFIEHWAVAMTNGVAPVEGSP